MTLDAEDPPVFARLASWLDDRTTFRKLRDAMLLEHIPGGAKWRYVWGSCLAFVFSIQLITGILLMTSYSAGDSTAWSSVWYIQYQMSFGWLIRGLHHFGSQTMVVLLGLHMLQVVIAGAQLPPRELNWWLGLALMGVVLGLSLTGYLLPWDQKGYWATQVATNIAGSLPVLGPYVQKVVVGGPEYGHSTLTRFYALHVGVLPPLLIVLLIAHIAVFRKQGVTAPKGATGEGWFWPDQAFRDLLVSLAIFGIMLALVLHGHGHKTEPVADKWSYDYWAHAGKDGLGANLDSPADPSHAYPARPEWYFLSLFQLLKYFEGDQKIIGTVVIPHAAAVVLFLLPLFGYGRMRPFGHILGVMVVTALLTAVGSLTLLALADDTVYSLARAALVRMALYALPAAAGVLLLMLAILGVLPRGGFRSVVGAFGWLVVLLLLAGVGMVAYSAMETDRAYIAHLREGHDPMAFTGNKLTGPVADWVQKDMREDEKKDSEKAKVFQKELVEANELAHRAVNLAGGGIPAAGALSMLQRDPATAGADLFKVNCASCHTFGTRLGDPRTATASDLEGFGSKEWIVGLLTTPNDPRFFGRTKLKEMANWVTRTRERQKGNLAQLEQQFDDVAAWLASHPRPDNKPPEDAELAEQLERGFQVYQKMCSDCHTWNKQGTAKGPDLTGYGDADWVRLMMVAPDHELRYPEGNTMPSFLNFEGPGGEIAKLEFDKRDPKPKWIQLNDLERELIIRFVLGDHTTVFGGGPMVSSLKQR